MSLQINNLLEFVVDEFQLLRAKDSEIMESALDPLKALGVLTAGRYYVSAYIFFHLK